MCTWSCMIDRPSGVAVIIALRSSLGLRDWPQRCLTGSRSTRTSHLSLPTLHNSHSSAATGLNWNKPGNWNDESELFFQIWNGAISVMALSVLLSTTDDNQTHDVTSAPTGGCYYVSLSDQEQSAPTQRRLAHKCKFEFWIFNYLKKPFCIWLQSPFGRCFD